jgi:hypothetical protein
VSDFRQLPFSLVREKRKKIFSNHPPEHPTIN